VLKISSFVLMLLPDASLVLKISSFVLMLLRCQPRAEDFQLRVDVVEMPASCCDFQLVLMLMRSSFVL
jgi:hypothetical protein